MWLPDSVIWITALMGGMFLFLFLYMLFGPPPGR